MNVTLSPVHSRPLAVFDLDETLIHCEDRPFREAQHSTEHGHVAVRDGVVDMLRQVNQDYDIMIWSTNKIEYIQDMLALFWPADVKILDIFTSQDSSIKAQEGVGMPFFKEMKRICKKHPAYPLSRIVGIDDRPEVYSRNFGNLIAVPAFKGQPDTVLSKLSDYLVGLAQHDNFRKVEKRYWIRSSAPLEASLTL